MIKSMLNNFKLWSMFIKESNITVSLLDLTGFENLSDLKPNRISPKIRKRGGGGSRKAGKKY